MIRSCSWGCGELAAPPFSQSEVGRKKTLADHRDQLVTCSSREPVSEERGDAEPVYLEWGFLKGKVDAINTERRGHCTSLAGQCPRGGSPKMVPDADCVKVVGQPAGCEKLLLDLWWPQKSVQQVF